MARIVALSHGAGVSESEDDVVAGSVIGANSRCSVNLIGEQFAQFVQGLHSQAQTDFAQNLALYSSLLALGLEPRIWAAGIGLFPFHFHRERENFRVE
jgi:hypothetical protein